MYKEHILKSSPEQLRRELDSLERTKQFNTSEARQKIYFVKDRLAELLQGKGIQRDILPENSKNWENDRLIVLGTCSFPPGVPYPD